MRSIRAIYTASVFAIIFIFCAAPNLSFASRLDRQAKTVTLDAPGWSLKRICASISQQIGQQVEPHGDIVNDYLIVHIHNVPWPELQRKLAWVEYGKWSLSGNTLTLEQDKPQVQARIQQQIDALAKRLKETFDKDQAAEKAKPFDAGQLARQMKLSMDDYLQRNSSRLPDATRQHLALYTALNRLRNKTPFENALRSMVESLPPQQLAALPNNVRVVFSNHPTALQYPFPQAVQDQITSVIASQDQFLKALAAQGVDLSSTSSPDDIVSVSDQDTFNVSIQTDFGTKIHAALRVFNESGLQVFSTEQVFGFPRPEIESGPAAKGNEFGTLSPEAVHDLKSLQSYNPAPASDDLLAKLREPDKVDPLQLSIEPMVRAVAGEKNIIIHNDPLMTITSAVNYFRNGDQIPMDFFTGPNAGVLSDADPDPAWLGLRDNLAYRTIEDSVPRDSYANLIQAIEPNGIMGFIPAMRFAYAGGGNGYISAQIAGNFYAPLTFGQNPLNQDPQGFELCSLVGSLSDGQIAQAQTSEGFPLARISSDSLTILRNIVLSRFNAGPPPQGAPVTLHEPTIEDEPTFAFTNGLPAAILHISASSRTVIRYSAQYDRNSLPQGMVESPQDLAYTLYLSGKESGGPTLDFSRMTVSEERDYQITISYLGTKLSPVTTTFVTSAHNPQTYNGWQTLPSTVRQEIEDQMNKLKSSKGE